MSTSTSRHQAQFKTELNCPHCWSEVCAHELCYIAESEHLRHNDTKLQHKPLRFLPDRFDDEGAALDEDNKPCKKLACPKCHLPIPRAWLEMDCFCISIGGAPNSGKSYFLASMIKRLRDVMNNPFWTHFTDADRVMNERIRKYEHDIFLADEGRVSIDKTDIVGDIYNHSRINGRDTTQLAQPFLYSTGPVQSRHPYLQWAERSRRIYCLYDNAGEDFLPGRARIEAPVTRHMKKADALLFVFDPTQDVRFRSYNDQHFPDHKLPKIENEEARQRVHNERQEEILDEMVAQIRTLNNLRDDETLGIPLIVVLTKYDLWKHWGSHIFPSGKAPQDYFPCVLLAGEKIGGYDAWTVDQYSIILKERLEKILSGLRGAAEKAAGNNVWYIPVSATGRQPEYGANDTGTHCHYYRSGTLKPIWAEVPFLHAQAIVQSAVPIPIISNESLILR